MGPSRYDFTPEGKGGLPWVQKMVIWGDFQGITGVTRGGLGVKKLEYWMTSFLDGPSGILPSQIAVNL